MFRARRSAATLLLAIVSSAALGVSPDGNAAWFGRIRSLQGSWEGPYRWTGARTDSGTMKVQYSTTGKGSAIVENLPAVLSVEVQTIA